jgi:hypothetical protein
MEGEDAANMRVASSQLLQAAHPTARRTAEASGASTRAASSPLEEIRNTASRMEAAGGASTWAAPRLLKQAAHRTVRHTAAAGAARRRAAPSTSLKLPAVCTARYVYRTRS